MSLATRALEAAIKAQQGALEKMTPEQRERYQEMMKSLGGGASERPGSR